LGNRSPPISGDEAHHWHRNEEEGAAHPTKPVCHHTSHVIDACDHAWQCNRYCQVALESRFQTLNKFC
jgi:hypothetical protein